jgi:hypothetical protein
MEITHRKYAGLLPHQRAAHWNLDLEDRRMAMAWRQEARHMGRENAGTHEDEERRAEDAMAAYRAQRKPLRDAIDRAARASDLPDAVITTVAMTAHQHPEFTYSAVVECVEHGLRALGA